MFADDLDLCAMVAANHGPLLRPTVECGGIPDPTIARYELTIEAMRRLRQAAADQAGDSDWFDPREFEKAQRARYLQIHRPLSFLDPDYACEDPSTGGVPLELIDLRYGTRSGCSRAPIGTAILLSVLEHVANPFECARALRKAMQPDGLAIVSVPFMFPEHKSPRDLWRFTPDALREVFCESAGWKVEWCDWRLRIGADEGVCDIHTGRPQAVESCACVARAA